MSIKLALSLSQVITNSLRTGDEMLNDSLILLNNQRNKMMVSVCIYVLPAKANMNKRELLKFAHATPSSIVANSGADAYYSNLLEVFLAIPENINFPR